MSGGGNFWPGNGQIWPVILRGSPLTTGWWDSAICHEPYVNVNNLGDDPLSTSEPLGSLTIHLVPINIYPCSLVIFVLVFTTKVTDHN
jgi:hypothetical protein